MEGMMAWTPSWSERGLGSILLKPPTGDLTRQAYRFALADRIDRLVSAEEPETARRLLDILEVEERLVAPRSRSLQGAFAEWVS